MSREMMGFMDLVMECVECDTAMDVANETTEDEIVNVTYHCSKCKHSVTLSIRMGQPVPFPGFSQGPGVGSA